MFKQACILSITAFAAFLLLHGACAQAASTGRFKVTVVDADTGKPLPQAQVTLHDSVSQREDVSLKLNSNGVGVSGELDANPWTLITKLGGYVTDSRTVNIAVDTTSSDEVDLAESEKVITIRAHKVAAQANQPTGSTNRGTDFTKTFTTGNTNSITQLMVTSPGIVQSSVGVVHARGEHAQISYQIGGALLGGSLPGKLNELISPSIVQDADIMTGEYAPEFGSEAAAIVVLNLKSGPVTPFQTVTMSTGSFDTQYGELEAGGQLGRSLEPGVTGPTPRTFRYLFDVSSRYSVDSVEPPQPDPQNAHNASTSTTGFADFDYVPDSKSKFTFVFNSTPASTQISNRTGLSSKYTPVGQGYGYGGGRNADGYESGYDPNVSGFDPTNPVDSVLGAFDPGATTSQQSEHQDIFQNDDDSEIILNYSHTFSPTTSGVLSFVESHSNLDIKNNNQSINLNSFNSDGTLTTTDNSIEFNPTILRHSTETELGGNITHTRGKHTYKVGFLAQDQVADNYYQFIPQSQLAVDALYSATTGGPQEVPNGTLATNNATDVNGNPIYLITPGASSPIVKSHRSGYYLAEYAQDTWAESSHFSLNYGARLDTYESREIISIAQPPVFETYLSPRLNTSYQLSNSSTFKLSYNKLFNQPPLTEGVLVGSPLKPETLDQYETSLEHQLSSNQVIKIDGYYKNIRRQNDTGILIPFTQTGAYTSLQYEFASVHGIEFSYDAEPKHGVGLGGFLSAANSLARPGGSNQSGMPAPTVNDHDQRWTVSGGISFNFKSGALMSAEDYFGSGEGSSALVGIFNNPLTLNGGQRNNNNQLNLRFATAPFLGRHKANAEIDIDNVFDDLGVLNFNSGFSGTRFQLGRTFSFKFTSNL